MEERTRHSRQQRKVNTILSLSPFPSVEHFFFVFSIERKRRTFSLPPSENLGCRVLNARSYRTGDVEEDRGGRENDFDMSVMHYNLSLPSRVLLEMFANLPPTENHHLKSVNLSGETLAYERESNVEALFSVLSVPF